VTHFIHHSNVLVTDLWCNSSEDHKVNITQTILDFKRANFSVINDYLNNIDWDTDLRNLDVNDAVNFVYYHFNHIIDSCVPSYTISRSSYPTWFSKELISVINNKRRAHFSFKCSCSYSDYLTFSYYRSVKLFG